MILILLCLLLTGCSGSKDNNTPKTTRSTTARTEGTTVATEEDLEAVGPDGEMLWDLIRFELAESNLFGDCPGFHEQELLNMRESAINNMEYTLQVYPDENEKLMLACEIGFGNSGFPNMEIFPFIYP